MSATVQPGCSRGLAKMEGKKCWGKKIFGRWCDGAADARSSDADQKKPGKTFSTNQCTEVGKGHRAARPRGALIETSTRNPTPRRHRVACPRGAMIRYWVARSEALRRGVNVKKAVLVHRQVEFAISRLPRVNASCTGRREYHLDGASRCGPRFPRVEPPSKGFGSPTRSLALANHRIILSFERDTCSVW